MPLLTDKACFHWPTLRHALGTAINIPLIRMMENIIEEMPIIVLPTVRPVPVSISHRCRLRTDVKNLPAGAFLAGNANSYGRLGV